MTTVGINVLKVTGQAMNISSEKLNYAEVHVRFKDAQGAILQTGVENVADLNPGDVWDFEVLYPSSNTSEVDSYEISVGQTWCDTYPVRTLIGMSAIPCVHIGREIGDFGIGQTVAYRLCCTYEYPSLEPVLTIIG
jgi:hypothetical protein